MVLCILAAAMPAMSAPPSGWWERFSDPNVRDQQAQVWLKGISKLDAAVPTLSPEQRVWLKTEYDEELQRNGGKYTQRALKASESLEYQIAVTKPRLVQLKGFLTYLSTRTPPYDFTKEAEIWTEVSIRFMDHEFWQAVTNLVRRGVVDKNIDGVDSYYFENHVTWAGLILEYGVLPTLQELNSPPKQGPVSAAPRQPAAPR